MALSHAALLSSLDGHTPRTLPAVAREVDEESMTAGHSERVTAIGVYLGERLGLSPLELETLRLGGLLHDIGKIGVPAEVLNKPGQLTPDEEELMRQHPEVGAHLLAHIPGCAEVVPIVLQHHEKYDGSGYPHGMRGEAISMGARIFAVADVFDALISDRPYRRGLSMERALIVMCEGRGTHFDPQILDEFIAAIGAPDFPVTVE